MLQLKVQYVQYLRDSILLSSLLDTVFHLMPETPLVQLKDSLVSQHPLQRLSSTKNMFSEPPTLNPAGM